MKFGIYSSIADPPAGENLGLRVEEVVAEAKLAESMGFDSCFFGEHHQDKDGFLPAPLIVSATVAAQTTKLNLGTSVILLPLHIPVKLAEEVIILDILSRGRFILGVGLGYQPVDFRTFDIPIEQRVSRFEEEIEIIRQCWKGERFDFSGEHFNLEDVAITPHRIRIHPRLCGLGPAGLPAHVEQAPSPTGLWLVPARIWKAPSR